MVYLQHSFDISSPPNFGTIKGRVILDLNANGKFDLNEPGIKGAKLRLEDGRESRTDQDGYFSFAYVSPHMQRLYIDLEDLPLELTCRELEKEICVSPRKETEVDFLLIKSATVKGRVFIDDNNDLVFQNNEEPIGAITILLQPGEQFRRTNQDGDFRFDYLLPGRYTIKIYSQDLPVGCGIVSSEEIELDLVAGQDIEDIDFVLEWESPIEKF